MLEKAHGLFRKVFKRGNDDKKKVESTTPVSDNLGIPALKTKRYGNDAGSSADTGDPHSATTAGKELEPETPSNVPTSSAGMSDDDEDNWGLFTFVHKDPDETGIVDIVALHGLNGHYLKTWSASSVNGGQVNWLQDMLPQHIPNARIMSFGYDANVQFSKSTSGISDFVEGLLSDLMSCRTSDQEKMRPIIFICHSLGGIVFKQAVVRARERDRFTDLLQHIRGVAFFGTPHVGSEAAKLGGLLARIMKASTLGVNTNTKVVTDLKKNSHTLCNINQSFVDRGKALHILTFYETQKMDFLGSVVVDKGSAILGVPDEIILPINGNHRTVCKFLDSKAGRRKFRPVCSHLKEMVDKLNVTEVSYVATSSKLPHKLGSPGESGISHGSNFKEERLLPKNQEGREELFKSLDFEHSEDRFSNIKPAHDATCKWLLTNERYQSWLDKSQISDHHGLLWLKGKPGAGKSTIMKFAFSEAKARSSKEEDIFIAFFFNARGSLLEKDTRGMYRSLLFQLFEVFPEAKEVFDNLSILEIPRGPGRDWTIPQLQTLLRHAIRELQRRNLWIFVDALDECNEDQIRDMVAFFNSLGDEAMNSDIDLRVFFASRYYPQIRTPKKVELRLDDEEEHSRDIERYIQSELRLGDDPQNLEALRVRGEVKRRASGVFIWAVLVVRILNKACDRGTTDLQRKLEEIPNDLGELFKGILTRDAQDEMEENDKINMRLCIQWILFAQRPLTREELYFAILSGTDREEAHCSDSEKVTTEIMDAFILSCSKGLAELTGEERPTVQFIHETVRDFLLKNNGMQYIEERSTKSLIGSGHDSLRQCCVNRISSTQRDLLARLPPIDFEHLDFLRGRYESLVKTGQEHLRAQRQIPRERPFIEYALSYVLCHANDAESHGVSQTSFLQEFHVRLWIYCSKIFEIGGEVHPPHSSLLYALAARDLGSLIKTMLRIDPRADIEGGPHGSPVLAALVRWNYDALGALLTPYSADGAAGCPASLVHPPTKSELTTLLRTHFYCWARRQRDSSVLQFFFQWGAESDFFTLLRSGRYGLNANISAALPFTPLSVAAERGYEEIVRFLLEKQEVNPDLQDSLGLAPLSKAAREGRRNIVILLLQGKKKANVNLRCLAGRSPLSYAAGNGHTEVLSLLLDQEDVEINLRDKQGRTPFFYAAARGQEDIIKLLIDVHRIDIISRDNMGHTALSYAVLHGHVEVVKLLLHTKKVELNSRDLRHGRTPLSIALEFKQPCIAALLREQPDIDLSTRFKDSIEPDSKDGQSGQTQLWLAAANGNDVIVKELLDADGVDLNFKDPEYGRTPLWCAAEGGYDAVVKLLLAKEGVDLDSEDTEHGQTPLSVAAKYGNKAVVEVLLAKGGVNLESEDFYGQTPLSWATLNGHDSIVQMLVDT